MKLSEIDIQITPFGWAIILFLVWMVITFMRRNKLHLRDSVAMSDRKATNKNPILRIKPFGWAVILFLVWMAIIFINALLNPPTPLTPEQLQAIQQREDAERASRHKADENQRAVSAKNKEICRIKAMCAQYGAARHACATAGSFDTCMSIKTENIPDADYYCSHDGQVLGAPSDGRFDLGCLILNLQ